MIFFDWKKGLVFIGFIHYLAARKTASVRKRKRNFPKRSTKLKRIVIQEKKTLYLGEQALLSRGRSSIQSRALHLKKLQRRNLRKKSLLSDFRQLCYLLRPEIFLSPLTMLRQEIRQTPRWTLASVSRTWGQPGKPWF